MALRFDASTDKLVRTAVTFPTSGTYTILGWCYLTTDQNTYSGIFSIEDAAHSTATATLDTLVNGTTMVAFDSTGSNEATGPFGAAMSTATWYRAAVTVGGGTTTVYSGTTTGALTASGATVTQSSTPDKIAIGGTLFGDFWNGRIVGVKVYNATLTAAEVEQELAQYRPVRTADLIAWYPLISDIKDYSGAGLDLTAGGTATAVEDGPSLPWERRMLPVVAAAGASGTNAPAGAAAASAAASNAAPKVSPVAGAGAATAAANNATVTTSQPAPAGAAAASAAALAAVPKVSPAAGAGAASAAALNASATTSQPAPAGAGAASAAASNATSKSAPTASAGTSTAAALDAGPRVGPPAGAAAAAAAALNATAQTVDGTPGAVRFDAASDRISYSADAPPTTFTITGWVYLSTDRNDFATWCRVWDAGVSTVATWATDGDGTSGPGYFTGAGSVVNSTGFIVGEWRKVAITRTGSTGQAMVATPLGSTEVDSGTVGTGTPAGITLGGRAPADVNEWLDGRCAYFRVWSSVLTQAQIEAEWASATPVITSGLWADWPLEFASDLTDHSGNGRHLVAGSTAVTQEAGPPIGAVAAHPTTGTATAAALNATATTSQPAPAGAGAATAAALAATTSQLPNAGAAAATAAALNATVSTSQPAPAGAGAATAAALNATASTSQPANAGSGAAAAAALPTSPRVGPAAGSGAGSASAYDATVSVSTSAGLATASAAAYDASTVGTGGAPAGRAQASAAALDATVKVASSAGLATVSAAGRDAAPNVGAAAGTASAAAAGLGATASTEGHTDAPAGTGAATATALDATAATAATAGTGAAAAAALNATAQVSAAAGLATVTAAALNGAPTVGARAGLASASATGQQALGLGGVGGVAGVGQASAAAHDATVRVSAHAGLAVVVALAARATVRTQGDTLVGSWWALVALLAALRLEPQPPELSCPHDGEPYRSDREGHLYCPFDGYRPGNVASMPLQGRDYGGLRAAMTNSPSPTPTDELPGWGPITVS